MNRLGIIVFGLVTLMACKSKIKESTDSIYSRHLQKHLNLLIITTPVPDNKSDFNLLILNDGQDADKFQLKTVVDSLYKKKLINPLIIVAVTPEDRQADYGIADVPDYQGNGNNATKYAAFIDDELYPFIKKNTAVRKFSRVTIAGCSLGGLSAFDIAWDHADKIDKVGVFSGSFWLRDKDQKDSSYSDDKDRLVINKIRSSRKKPHLKYWFYVGDKEETADRDKDGIIDAVDDTKDLIEIIKTKNVTSAGDIVFTENKEGVHDYISWRQALPQFLIWAVGK